MNTQSLASLYHEILSDIDISLLDRQQARQGSAQNLSGLFLTSEPDKLRLAQHRVMLVGCETRGWDVLKKEPFTSLECYIDKSLSKHKQFFADQLGKKDSRGCFFHNFARSLGARCGKDGLIYSNLFCFSWKSGSPIKSPYFEVIRKYSGTLLRAQIEFFRPHIIIFANGMNSAFYRREVFPIDGPGRVCRNGKDYSEENGVSKHHLWEFELDDGIRCFRIHHPSSRHQKAVEARNFLLTLLPSATAK